MTETFLTRRFLFYPVLLLIFLFCFDKLFSLESIRKYTESRPEFTFYDCKKKLLQQLLQFQNTRTPEQKLLVLFGTSHMGEFSNQYIKTKEPTWETYNFSAPMAPPSYLFYNLDLILKSNVKIDYAVLEIIPETLREEANEYALKFSYDAKFMFDYRNNFSKEEIEMFIKTNLFSMSRYPAKIKTVIDRISSSESRFKFSFFNEKVNEAVQKNNGGIPNPILYEMTEEKFEKESELFFRQIFTRYKESETQKFFFKEFLRVAKENKIRLLIFKPLVSKQLSDKQKNFEPYNLSWSSKVNFAKEKFVPVLDIELYRPFIECKKFVDVHHLSGGCYPEITDLLITKLKSDKQ
jgi:hypothetical protein